MQIPGLVPGLAVESWSWGWGRRVPSNLGFMSIFLFWENQAFTIHNLWGKMQYLYQLYWVELKFTCSVVSDSLQPHGLQHARLPCPSPTPGAYSNSLSIVLVMPSNHLILSSPSSPTFNPSQHQDLFQWVSSSHQVAKVLVLQLQLQHQSFQWIFRTDFL